MILELTVKGRQVIIQGTVDEIIEFLNNYTDDYEKDLDNTFKLNTPLVTKALYKSCEDCEWFKSLDKSKPYFGDTPCNWCPNRQATCLTLTSNADKK